MPNIEQFKDKYGLRDQSFLLFPFGSRIYGTATDRSDYDFMAVILDKKSKARTGEEYRNHDTNIHIYSRDDWQYQLNEHKIHTLEAYFLPDGVCRTNFKFKLNLKQLRHSLSEKASNSWVKAKKKIEKEKDYFVGWKSLFHSLRILTFGSQIASMEKIDYSSANHYWFDIPVRYEWDYFEEKYKPIYNQLATEFRRAAPK